MRSSASSRKLLAKDIEGLVVNLLFSYANGAHEQKVKGIAEAVMKSRNTSVPIYLSSELYPVVQDFARLNTVTIEAYAAEPSRGQFQKIADRAKDFGGKFELRVMASHGGTISTEAKELARTLISGPIGGMVGSRHLGNNLGVSNVVCTDIGGTSFDLGLITAGEFTTKSQPNMAISISGSFRTILSAQEPVPMSASTPSRSADAFIAALNDRAIIPVIPSKSNRKTPRSCDFALYCERNLIERFFNKLKHFRAIATRYDKLAKIFLAGVQLACAAILLN